MRRSAFLPVGVLFFLIPAPARAHTEFESSTPADQESVDTPVSEIVVSFTLPVAIVGHGFEVLDPQGLAFVDDRLDHHSRRCHDFGGGRR